jgi:hypothetical protein
MKSKRVVVSDCGTQSSYEFFNKVPKFPGLLLLGLATNNLGHVSDFRKVLQFFSCFRCSFVKFRSCSRTRSRSCSCSFARFSLVFSLLFYKISLLGVNEPFERTTNIPPSLVSTNRFFLVRSLKIFGVRVRSRSFSVAKRSFVVRSLKIFGVRVRSCSFEHVRTRTNSERTRTRTVRWHLYLQQISVAELCLRRRALLLICPAIFWFIFLADAFLISSLMLLIYTFHMKSIMCGLH